MRRKITMVGIIWLMVIGGLLGFITCEPEVVSASATRYVGGTGGGNYTTIQDAINASNDGDTVFVYGGTYYENVVVDKTINLTGEDRDYTIIDGGGSGDVVYVSANWVNITGLTITNGGLNGIKISSDYVIITYNNIISNNWDGVNLDSQSSNINIIGNNVLNNDDGILLHFGTSNNLITDNNISGNEWGIYLYFSTNNKIGSNNISRNDRIGIYLRSSSSNKMISNNISLNNGIGIFLSDSTYNNLHSAPLLNTF